MKPSPLERLYRTLPTLRPGLGLALVLRAALWAVLAALLIASLQVWLAWTATNERIAAQFEHIARAMVPVIAENMWAYDTASVALSSRSIAELPSVAHVVITSADKPILDLGIEPARALVREYPLNHEMAGELTHIGQLRVAVDSGKLEAELFGRFAAFFGVALLGVVLVTIILLALFERRVTRHLRRAADFVSTLGPDNLTRRLRLHRRPSPAGVADELDRLVQGIAGMQASLRESIARLEHDIALRQVAEANVLELNASLERKVSERTRQLWAAHRSAEQVLELTRSAFWTRRTDSPHVEFSARASRLLGLDWRAHGRYVLADDCYAHIAVVSPASVAALDAASDKLDRGEQRSFFEVVPFRRPRDRNIIWIEVVGQIDERYEGGVLISGSLQDVTAQKAIEGALRVAHAHADTVLQLTRSGYWTRYVDTDEIRLEQRTVDFLGLLPRADGVYHMSSEIVPHLVAADAGAAAVLVARMQRADAGAPAEGPIVLSFRRPRDGRIIWVRMATGETQDSDRGRVRLGSIQDVTESMQTQLALAQARDEAHRANRAKDEFLANMSHELRTPLNGMLGMVQLLRRSSATSAQRGYIERIEYSAAVLLAIVNDVLDFSKIESGALQLENVPFHLLRVIDNIAAMLAVRAEEKGIAFHVHLPPDLPHELRGDPLRLGQVLNNLGSNAIKFTETGSVSIRVAPQRQDEQGLMLRFDVVDTGIGIDAATQTQLFSPFTQADSSISRRFGGSGLGLAICKRLVERMGGEITLVSAPGRGSTFSFNVRFTALSAAASALLAAPAAQPKATVPGALAGRHLLIVDDNTVNQEVLRELIESEGGSACLAADGAQAVALLAHSRAGGRRIDAVLMDIQMPVQDGYSATAEMRRDPANAALPILGVSAHGTVGVRERSLAAGMNDYLTKPVSFDDLLVCLQRHLPPVVPTETTNSPTTRGPGEDATPVIDTAAALLRLRGRQSSYVGLLKIFQSIFQEFTPRYCADIGSEQRINLTHELKGAAASIGATRVRKLAAEQELLLRAGKPVSPDDMARLCAALDAALLRVNALLAAPPGTPRSVWPEAAAAPPA